MEWIIICVILLLSLLIYCTVKTKEGFQEKFPAHPSAEIEPVSLDAIQNMYAYGKRILEEKKDIMNDNIRKLRSITEKLRETIEKTNGDKTTIVYTHNYRELHDLHVLIKNIMQSG